ncbi:MAG: hypothetical protein WC760_07905 [Bacteroidia bacterium]
MIKHYRHSEIDKTKWDLCLSQSVNSMIYGYSWYLDIVSPDWEALVFNDYDAVFPLTHRKKIFPYLYTPFFTQQLGMFIKPGAPVSIHDFLREIPKAFRYIDIQLNETNLPDEEVWQFKKRKNFVLDLNKQHAKLVKDFSDTTQRNIKKALKAQLRLDAIDPDCAVDFYIQHKGQQTRGLNTEDYDRLKVLLKAADQHHMLLCRGVFNSDGTLLASAIIFTTPTRLYLINNSSSDIGRELRAMYFLIDQLIFQFAHQPLLLDFEGSEIEGVARFYKGFGSEKRYYFRYRKNLLPWWMKWIKD